MNPLTQKDQELLNHFNYILSTCQKDGAFQPDFEKVQYTIVKCRHHIGNGVFNPYIAVRANRVSDGKKIYQKPCTAIRFDDGTVSVWWYGANSNIFAMDNVVLPS